MTHVKRLLAVSEDAHTRAWMTHAASHLDVRTNGCGIEDLRARLVAGEADILVLDGGRSPEPLVQAVEQTVSTGAEVKLLLVIEPEALSGLRLPIRLSADFFVRGGSSDELTARIRSLLWPGEEVTQQELVRIDELTLNLATYQAYLGSEPIDFTYLEYALFAFLITHPGRTYSREVLLRRVWGSEYFGGARTVDVHVRRIRSKIGPELSRRLETVRNVGYLWNG